MAAPSPAQTTSGVTIYERFVGGLAQPACAEASPRWRKHFAHVPGQLAAGDSEVLPLFGYVVESLRSAHLPTEYALIPFVESGYRPGARSSSGPAGLWQFIALTARSHDIPIRTGYAVTGTQGHLRLKKAFVAPLDGAGTRVFGGGEPIECDLLVSSGGWSPTVHLFCQSKGTLQWDEQLACFRPATPMQRNQAVVGAANGTFGLAQVLSEGHQAALAATAAAVLPARRSSAVLSRGSSVTISASSVFGSPPARASQWASRAARDRSAAAAFIQRRAEVCSAGRFRSSS